MKIISTLDKPKNNYSNFNFIFCKEFHIATSIFKFIHDYFENSLNKFLEKFVIF